MIAVCLPQVGGLGLHTLCPQGMLSRRMQLGDTLLSCSVTLRIQMRLEFPIFQEFAQQ